MEPIQTMEPIQILLQDLDKAFEEGGDGIRVRTLLEGYVAKHEDWKGYANFCPHKYARNLVTRTPHYELMVICWGEDQVSPIHNHEGQHCWMGVLDGALEETYFVFSNTNTARGTGPLRQFESNHLATKTVGYITDDIALHVIKPCGGKAVSLHLYSLPIPECNVYCPRTGTITRRKTGFYSQYKKILPVDHSTGCHIPTQST